MPDASVSVVVATHNRAGWLPRLLAALAAQDGAPEFETVVVDDASTDGTWDWLQGRAANSASRLVCFRQEVNRGPAAARNRGWRAAAGQLVCFTDDDCVPQPGWVASLVNALGSADLVQGKTVPNPEQQGRWGPFSHTVEILAESGFYETCNMGYRRAVLEATGGIDETFTFPFGEDTELAWRAKKAGAHSAFAADAVVYHEVGESDFWRHLRSLRRDAALVQLVRLRPETRALFPGPWYHKATHPPALLSAAAVAALALHPTSKTGWAVALGAFGLYTRVALKTWKSPARFRQWSTVLPLTLAADLAEIATLARASVQERTFFL